MNNGPPLFPELIALKTTRTEMNVWTPSLPGGFRQWFQEAINDPEILSVTAEAGVLQARINTLLTRMDEQGHYPRINDAWGRFDGAI